MHGGGDSYQQAVGFYQQGDFQSAGRLCEQLLRKNRNDVAALELSAGVALQLGQISQAAGFLSKQLELQPNNAIAHNNLGMALHALGRDEEAYQHCDKALKIQPELAEAYNNIGNIHKGRNNLKDALESYEKALELGIQDPRVFVNAGLVCQLLGDLSAAEQRYRDVLARYPDFTPAHNNLGAVLQKLGRYEEAEICFQRVLGLQPNDPEAHNNMGALWLAQGELERAQKCFEQAIQLDAGYVGAYTNLGYLCEVLNNLEASREYYEKAISLDPTNPIAHTNLGYQLFELGEQKQAIEHYVQALEGDPNHAPALAALGEAELRRLRKDQAEEYIAKALELAPLDPYVHRAKAALEGSNRRYERAEAEWRKVIELRPHAEDGYLGLAGSLSEREHYDDACAMFRKTEEVTGGGIRLYHEWSASEEHRHNLDEAERLANKAVEIDPSYPGAVLLKARLLRRRKAFDAALEALLQVNEGEVQNKQFRSGYLFELGAVQDKLGNYKEAFAAYDAANRLKNEYIGAAYNEAEDQRMLEEYKAFFSSENWARLRETAKGLKSVSPTPVFIVGFPRSGTSLLEQILGSHPEIAPAGELAFISDLVQGRCKEIMGSTKGYPYCLLDPERPLGLAELEAMRDYYLSSVAALGVADGQSRWVTDKMPHNAMQLGLIALLFPGSPVIHISRHPLDSCLSAYFSNFNSAHRYTSSLESTAKHYARVMERLEHYKQALDMRFMEVRYQDLVDDQEAEVRRLLDFIGAPWDEACLQHHKSKRVVKTASYEQVTQKVYRSSLARYRNYWEAVQPIIPLLEPTIKRFGYPLD